MKDDETKAVGCGRCPEARLLSRSEFHRSTPSTSTLTAGLKERGIWNETARRDARR